MEVAEALISPVIATHAIIVSGATLQVRYRAENVHGWSVYSAISTIIVATAPTAP